MVDDAARPIRTSRVREGSGLLVPVWNQTHFSARRSLISGALAAVLYTLSAGDFLARYGGEEFVVLLPSPGAAAAEQHAERLRQRIERAAIEHVHGRAAPVITVSLGVATTDVSEDDGHALLLIAADEQLYDAKELGRNRVAATRIRHLENRSAEA